jgi:hypothetical protein
VDCPVCQVAGGCRKVSEDGKKSFRTTSAKKASASQTTLVETDLKKILVEMLEKRRSRLERKYSRMTVNPLSGESGWAPPDSYPKGVTEKDLRAFHSRTGIELPDDAKEWLRITNGPPGFCGLGSAQKSVNMEGLWQLFPDWRNNGWIPVGTDDFGNYYVRVVPKSGRQGGVFFVEANISDKLVYAVASDTLHFALFYLKHFEALETRRTSGWPQDKSFVLSQDPALARVVGAPLYVDL